MAIAFYVPSKKDTEFGYKSENVNNTTVAPFQYYEAIFCRYLW